MEQTNKLTLEQLNSFKPTEEQILSAELLFINMANVDIIKPIVSKYQKAILEKHKFKAKTEEEQKYIYKNTFLNYISRDEDTYLMKKNDFEIYLKEMEEQHYLHGFVVKKDYDPLLIAKSNLIDAKVKFVNSMSSLTGIKWKDITKLKHYDEIVELNLRFIAKFLKPHKEILQSHKELVKYLSMGLLK